MYQKELSILNDLDWLLFKRQVLMALLLVHLTFCYRSQILKINHSEQNEKDMTIPYIQFKTQLSTYFETIKLNYLGVIRQNKAVYETSTNTPHQSFKTQRI